ncbi:MAG: EboA domain-containing protein [Bdellovibrionales bacterium]|nr:EboA domain-containing protein [Bdellovibrionales bacterium]
MQNQIHIQRFAEENVSEIYKAVRQLIVPGQSHYERLGIFASLHRAWGDDPVRATGKAAASWAAQFSQPFPFFFNKTDWARLLFLIMASEHDADFLTAETFDSMIRRGDHSEQITLAKILFYLPEAGEYRQTAERMIATNSSDVFKSLAHHNPYPMAYFSDLMFQQMVLKALFIDLPSRPILGLDQRANAELFRMANDYVREREIASRSVPRGFAYIESLQAEARA